MSNERKTEFVLAPATSAIYSTGNFNLWKVNKNERNADNANKTTNFSKEVIEVDS